MLEWIQNWYNQQCDGHWEHYYGVKIENIDNPGWDVKIDFNDTGLIVEQNIDWQFFEMSETNWIGYKVVDNVFEASGDPFKLELILSLFKMLAETGTINKSHVSVLISK